MFEFPKDRQAQYVWAITVGALGILIAMNYAFKGANGS